MLYLTTVTTCLAGWLEKYEPVAVWIEAVALVAIFILDWRVRTDQQKEAKEQHEQTREQIGVLQRQVEALRRQEEAIHRPALLFPAIARDEQDAILERNGIAGAMVVMPQQGQLALMNVGSGPAINIRYELIPSNPELVPARPDSYLSALPVHESFPIPVSRQILRGSEWRAVLTYESLSGRRYRTHIIVNDLVLVDVRFEEVS